MMFFGPGYTKAVEGEKQAAAIEWGDGMLGTPFIEVDPAVVTYIDTHGDACTRNMFAKMAIAGSTEAFISPYGIFDRLASLLGDPSKSPEEGRAEFDSARKVVDLIERSLISSRPVGPRAEEKLRISRQELSKARHRLTEAEELLSVHELKI
jgi:hypothetical protein